MAYKARIMFHYLKCQGRDIVINQDREGFTVNGLHVKAEHYASFEKALLWIATATDTNQTSEAMQAMARVVIATHGNGILKGRMYQLLHTTAEPQPLNEAEPEIVEKKIVEHSSNDDRWKQLGATSDDPNAPSCHDVLDFPYGMC